MGDRWPKTRVCPRCGAKRRLVPGPKSNYWEPCKCSVSATAPATEEAQEKAPRPRLKTTRSQGKTTRGLSEEPEGGS